MTTAEDIRHANLLTLIAEAGGQRALADRISEYGGRPLAPAQISQWATRAPDSKTGKPRVIHSTSARRIEAAMRRPSGWMDQDHALSAAAPAGARKNMPWEESDGIPETHGAMKRIEVYLSAGNGNGIAEESPEYETPNLWRAEFMRARGWSSDTHYSMYVDGDSMEPTIPDGASIVVDVSDREPRTKKASVYAIYIDGEPRLKRLLKLPSGAVRVSSDNPRPEYAAFEIGPESRNELKIIGRVVFMQSVLD